MTIGWYPGHMHKARKDITSALQQVDAVIELVDARLPYSSENPLLNILIGNKPRLRVLNKADLADPVVSAGWLQHYKNAGLLSLMLDRDDPAALKRLMKEVTSRLEYRSSRASRIMIVGIPNVGKSTLINLLAERRIAKVGNEPAVTKARQEIKLNDNLTLLDTPGILWPRIEDQQSAYRLAATGAIRNTAIELGDIGLFTVEFLQARYPDALQARYGFDPAGMEALGILDAIGRKRGCLTRAGVDLARAGEVVINDLRTGKLGRLSLETPDDIPLVAPPETPADES